MMALVSEVANHNRARSVSATSLANASNRLQRASPFAGVQGQSPWRVSGQRPDAPCPIRHGAPVEGVLPGGNSWRRRCRVIRESLMSETTPAPQPGTPAQQPPLVVNIQYVKDLSFEVPGAPNIYTTLRQQPQVAINLDVQARRIVEGGPNYEVTLMIRAEATDGAPGQGDGQTPPPVVFIAELTYGGVFTLTGLPDNAIEPVLLVECPRILFPFARNILADVSRDGGFPPVLLQPIDFVQLWQSRRARQAAAGTA
jgi:preprotein translocase subunit SecB